MQRDVAAMARAARVAGRQFAAIDGTTRTNALRAIADAIDAEGATLQRANDDDLSRAVDLAAPLRKRLRFDAPKRSEVVASVRAVAELPDPVGRTLERRELDSDLTLERVAAPIGVIAMVFESRPDALVQIASLAARSGNALLLKGGSEASSTNRALAQVIVRASIDAGLPAGWLQLLETREEVGALLACDRDVDLVIPRGSNEFVRAVMEGTRIPVLGHADGICHLYVDRAADARIAVDLAVDAKTQYVAVCNAIETLLVHRDASGQLPEIIAALRDKGVEVRGCERTRAVVADVVPAVESDWATEYLDLIISIRVVDSLDDAIDHINRWGSGHTDAIVTEDTAAADAFIARVDSASVMWNASTRFADGFRYGLGAEVGIATGRIHARGPVGVEGLLTYRWVVRGVGQRVAPYADGTRHFTHRDLPVGERGSR